MFPFRPIFINYDNFGNEHADKICLQYISRLKFVDFNMMEVYNFKQEARNMERWLVYIVIVWPAPCLLFKYKWSPLEYDLTKENEVQTIYWVLVYAQPGCACVCVLTHTLDYSVLELS